MWDARNLIFDIRCLGARAPYLKEHIDAKIHGILQELNQPSATVYGLTKRLRRASAQIDIKAAELAFELIENTMVFNQVHFIVAKPLATKKSQVFTAVRQLGCLEPPETLLSWLPRWS